MLELSIALGDHPRAKPLIDGTIEPQGIRLRGETLGGSELFYRQLTFAEFDISEMSMSSLLILANQGPPMWVAIPVFTRAFHYTKGGLVRKDRGIETPADLRGKKLGVPEYQQTAALWARGILKDDWGVDARDIEWWMERPPEKSHGGATGFTPPPGIRLEYIPRDTDMAEMVVNGALDGALLFQRGNAIDRSSFDLHDHPEIKRLYPSPAAEAARYYGKSGIYPINHTVVVRRSILAEHPWVARSLYRAFFEAKKRWRAHVDAQIAPWFETGQLGEAERAALDTDLYAYGIAANRHILEKITQYSYDQGLTNRVIGLEELFDPSVMAL